MEHANPKDAAVVVAQWINNLVDAIADQFIAADRAGIDPNGMRETARDAMVAHGMGPVQAANIVRLATVKFNRLAGVETYDKADLREICSRVASMA